MWQNRLLGPRLKHPVGPLCPRVRSKRVVSKRNCATPSPARQGRLPLPRAISFGEKFRANRPHKSTGATPPDGEHVEIERSGKRESTTRLHRLPTLLALALAHKWCPNLGSARPDSDQGKNFGAREEAPHGGGIISFPVIAAWGQAEDGTSSRCKQTADS
jgi:hypothetical protein